MYIADRWADYEVLDAGAGRKLERWGDILLLRPDPQAIWPARSDLAAHPGLHAVYHRAGEGGGHWEYRRPTPQAWQITYGALRFAVKPLGFKHTGLFPEQAVNWDWMAERIKSAGKPCAVLNLFAYTGGATMACAAAGAAVTHVDAAKGMVNWAGENAQLCALSGKPIRYLIDDCLKFVQREARRGRKYDNAIVMDPPSYGRGPNGEMWKLGEQLGELLSACMAVLSDDPVFFLVNSYTTGLQPIVLGNLLQGTVQQRFGGRVEAAEVALPISGSPLLLPCGAAGRWRRV